MTVLYANHLYSYYPEFHTIPNSQVILFLCVLYCRPFSLDNIPELTPVLLCNGLVNPHAVHLVSLGEFVKVHRLQLQPVTAHWESIALLTKNANSSRQNFEKKDALIWLVHFMTNWCNGMYKYLLEKTSADRKIAYK